MVCVVAGASVSSLFAGPCRLRALPVAGLVCWCGPGGVVGFFLGSRPCVGLLRRPACVYLASGGALPLPLGGCFLHPLRCSAGSRSLALCLLAPGNNGGRRENRHDARGKRRGGRERRDEGVDISRRKRKRGQYPWQIGFAHRPKLEEFEQCWSMIECDRGG